MDIAKWAPEYQFNIIYDPNRCRYRGHAPDLRGTEAEGRTVEETHANLVRQVRNWLAIGWENDLEVPRPKSRKLYSGKFVLRVSEEMHGQLSREAGLAGVSLNSLILDALTVYLRNRKALHRPT